MRMQNQLAPRDLREQIRILEERGKLIRVKRSINKDTELHPLVRWQFRGLRESERKGFLFENVTDVRGHSFGMPVAVGVTAGSQEIYDLGLGCENGDVHDKWQEALRKPVRPTMVDRAPVQDIVH